MISPDTLQGLTAEYMVCVDLCRQGYPSYLAPAGMRYDVLADVNGRVLRIQVKSTRGIRRINKDDKPCYLFPLKSKWSGKKIQSYEVDVVALVAMDVSAIAYVSALHCLNKARVQFKPPNTENNCRTKFHYNIDQLPFSKLLQELRQ